MSEKLKSENMQKEQFSVFMVYFESNQSGQAGVENGAMLTTYLFRLYFRMHSGGLMPIEARGNYLPKPPYLRETKTYHSQPLESIRHAGNYFVPLSIRTIFIFCCKRYVKLLDY